MARAPTKAATDAEEKIDAFTGTIEGFRSTLGAFGTGAVKISRKNPRTQKYEYVNKVPITEENFDQFTDQLREDYPEGGEFMLQLIDALGRTRSNATISLAALPEKDRKTTSLAPSRDNEMFMMMMQMQQRQAEQQAQSSRDQMSLMMTLQAQSQQSQTALLTAILPALVGNKSGDNPVAMFAALAGVMKEMAPKANEMENTLSMLKLAKELLPEAAGGGDEGLGGLLKAFAPMLLPMAAGAMQQAQTQPRPQMTPQQQTAPSPVYVNTPQLPLQPGMEPVDNYAPELAPQPEVTEEQNAAMLALIQKYTPFMNGLKAKLETGADADTLCDYVDASIDALVIGQDDIEQLFDTLEKNPSQLEPVLGIFGITSPEHAGTIRDAIGLYGGELEDGDGQGGDAGDTSSPDTDVGNSADQPDEPASASEGAGTGQQSRP